MGNEPISADMAIDCNAWGNGSFVEKVREGPTKPPIYTDENELDEFGEADLSFIQDLNMGPILEKRYPE